MSDELRKQENVNPETAADMAEGDAPEEQAECQDDVLDLRAALTQCRQELADAKNSYLRAHADFDNFRKRMRAERDQEFGRGADRVLSDLLPILDDFERALSAVTEANQEDSVIRGVVLIYRQLQGLLGRYGVSPMDAKGKPFDPKYHDAINRLVTTAVPEHTIVEEITRGYLKNGDVFRPAKVVVAIAPEEELPEG